jgi:pyruvate carboxylase subunit B
MKYVVKVGSEDVDVSLDADVVQVDRVVARRGPTRGRYTLWLDGFRYEVEALDERTRAIRELSGAAAGPSGPAPFIAPMPGMIVRVAVQVGDVVQAGQGLVVMEAMKMENEIRSPRDGHVKDVVVKEGQAVESGALLILVE